MKVINSAESIKAYKGLQEAGGISIQNGMTEVMFSAKDLCNNGESLETKVRILNDSGYSFDISTTETLIAEVLHQKFFQYGHDIQGNPITLERLLPIDSSGIGAYKDGFVRKVARQIIQYSRSSGLAPFGMKAAPTELSDISMDSLRFQNYALDKDIQYDINEVRQARYSEAMFDIISEKEKATANAMKLQLRDNILGGNPDFKGGDLNGLFNINGAVNDTVTIPSNPATMTQAEYLTMIGDLLSIRNDALRQTLDEPLNTLVIPMDIASKLQGMAMSIADAGSTSTGLISGNRLSYLKASLPGVEVIESHFGSKDSISSINPFSGSKYQWLFYSNSSDVLQAYMPVTPTITGYATANNFRFQTKLMTQFTGVMLYRPQGYVMMTHS
jgi:hypothetical protein